MTRLAGRERSWVACRRPSGADIADILIVFVDNSRTYPENGIRTKSWIEVC